MHSYTLRVNCNHLRPMIQSEYLLAKDTLYRATLFNTAIVHYLEKPLSHNLQWEEQRYNELHNISLGCGGLRQACDALGLTQPEMRIAMDISSYVKEFIHDRYMSDRMCYMSLRIDTSCHMLLEMTRLRVRAPASYQVDTVTVNLTSRQGEF